MGLGGLWLLFLRENFKGGVRVKCGRVSEGDLSLV